MENKNTTNRQLVEKEKIVTRCEKMLNCTGDQRNRNQDSIQHYYYYFAYEMNNDENIALIQRWWVWSKIGTFSCFCWMYKLVVSLESNLATSLQRLKHSSLFFVIPNAGIYCDEIFQDCTKIWITELFVIM